MKGPRHGSGLHIKGWHDREYLPHFDPGEETQMITVREEDSLPVAVLERWKYLVRYLPEEAGKTIVRKRVEAYLDQGYGRCDLRKPPVAKKIQESLFEFRDIRYRLHCWVIMPNHLHFMITPMEGHDLSAIIHSIKSYTANEANRILGLSGGFWQDEYFDRRIRDRRHFASAFAYIENNPVKAKLCAKPAAWKYGSAYFPEKEERGAAQPARFK